MLSVVCPIYNEEKYIANCIESLLKQDYSKDDLPTYKLTFSFETFEKQYNPTKDGIEQLIRETHNNITQVNTTQNNRNSTQVNSNVDSFNAQ